MTPVVAMISPDSQAEAETFVRGLVERLAPLLEEANAASWEAAVGGDPSAHERSARARSTVKQLLSRADDWQRVRGLLAADGVMDPLLRRQLRLLDLDYTGNQLTPETIEDLVRRSTELEKTFHTFRSTLEGRPVSNNEILDVLAESMDGAARRAAWEASKQIGAEVAEPLLELVRRRNTAARGLGFPDFYQMELELQELSEAQLFAIVDRFRDLSDAPFGEFRRELDTTLAHRFGVSVEDLRPWHWDDPFAQEAPGTGALALDRYFEHADPERRVAAYFRDLGLPLDDVMERSDLYEREGKDQHAFCIDVDRQGDVRILCNLRDNEKWTSTLLHELGHAAFDKYIPRDLPFLLRGPAHTLTTEAVAMYMGRLTRDADWLRQVMGAEVDDEEALRIREQLRAAMLVSTRWMLVMIYFERELYRNPDRADLNSLWWDLVERLQLIPRPEGRDAPDWAAKIHLSLSPVYYQNYLLGELMASQLTAAAPQGDDRPSRHVGEYLRERVFAPGMSLDWNALLVHATGEELNPRHFLDQFVGS